jgi:hypothetical protein
MVFFGRPDPAQGFGSTDQRPARGRGMIQLTTASDLRQTKTAPAMVPGSIQT